MLGYILMTDNNSKKTVFQKKG